MNSFKMISFMLLCLLFDKVSAQHSGPKIQIGQPLPEFAFSGDDHGPSNLISNKDIKNKHTILYYWNTGCSGCIVHFAKVNALQQQFGDRLHIISIGLNFQKHDSHIKKIYETYQKKWNLILTSVYDTTFAIKNGIDDLPVIWVDDKGIVKAYHSSVSVTEKNIQLFFAGNLTLEDIRDESKIHNEMNPLLVNGNGGIDDNNFMFRSVLGAWEWSMPVIDRHLNDLQGRRNVDGRSRYQFELAGYSLSGLFLVALTNGTAAYFENNRENFYIPIFEGTASKRKLDSLKYFYSLVVPDSTYSSAKIRKYMLEDLERYFGCTATIEKRLLPCWIIKAEKGAMNKLRTKGGREAQKRSQISATFINKPFTELLKYLEKWALGRIQTYLKGSEDNFLRVYNGSDIPNDLHVDVELKTTRADSPEHINQELKKYGLSIVRENRLQNALVIKDVDK